MALNVPVPEGGTADYLAVLSSDAHSLTDRRFLGGSAIWDPASLADGTQESKDFTVTGAVLGDFAIAGAGIDVQDMCVSAVVTAANTVTVTIKNDTGGTIDLTTSTWGVIVIGGP